MQKILFLTKMSWATVWVIFSQTHLVALLTRNSELQAKFIFDIKSMPAFILTLMLKRVMAVKPKTNWLDRF
jgi:hypothetical protein